MNYASGKYLDLSLTVLFVLCGLLIMQTAVLAAQPLGSTEAPAIAPNKPASGAEQSLNWSGYVADTDAPYTSVSGSWIVPSIETASARGIAADATWVGIGGVSSNDLIQAGTQAITDGQGNIVYEAWVELIPEESTPVDMDIAPGDSVSVSIDEVSAGEWRISIINHTQGESYEHTFAYDSSRSSVEWIEEMPSSAVGNFFIPLDRFGSVTFSDARATTNGSSHSAAELGAEPLTMSSYAGEDLAVPGLLSANGESFKVTRTESSGEVVVSRRHRGGYIYIYFNRALATPHPSPGMRR